MKIGIDGSRAFLPQRTGIEEYSYQVIKNLRDKLGENQIVLYARKNQEIDFALPKNWKVKIIAGKYFWTQIGLSLEMILRPVDVLFVPAHTVPVIHPQKTIVTVHGLEYELAPDAYSWRAKLYMRTTIKKSCDWARKIIAVSKNTRKDLVELYEVPEKKITVIYEGCDAQFKNSKTEIKNTKYPALKSGYLLFIGRMEERKNVVGIISAFEILKTKYSIPHKLVLAGKSGYGYDKIKFKIQNSKFKKDIIETGFISEDEKWIFLKNADVFLFPSFYEGFGIPILEAQNSGTPVVCSNSSSLREVCDNSAALVDPNNSEFMAERVQALINDLNYRNDIIKKGYENAKRFSWEKCATEIAKILMKK